MPDLTLMEELILAFSAHVAALEAAEQKETDR